MKHTILLFAFIVLSRFGFSQPIVYFDFVTHNEETPQWNNTPYYNANRTQLITLANYFQSNGVAWNLQSDWVYLTNVLTKETPSLKALTNNKNILVWLQSDKGVEIDPHAHESMYIYPDVVKLMDSVGLPESKLVGGSIYNDSNGKNIWTNLSNGQYGKIFTGRFWKPDYMMGGGTPNHVADIDYYGVWNPQSPTSYLTHDTAQHLRHLGIGCSIKIKDTSVVANVVADIRALVQRVQTGQYPSNGFYLQSIFFEQGDLNTPGFYNKVKEVADSVSAIVASGKAQWKTLKQAYTLWETNYNSQMFQWECGQLVGITTTSAARGIKIYPNPAKDKLFIENGGLGELTIYAFTGAVVRRLMLKEEKHEIDLGDLPKGMYFVRTGTGAVQKLVLE